MMTFLRRATALWPGEWTPFKHNKKQTAYLICPNGHNVLLTDYYQIDSDGLVEPEARCIFPGCGWEDHIFLEDWEEGF